MENLSGRSPNGSVLGVLAKQADTATSSIKKLGQAAASALNMTGSMSGNGSNTGATNIMGWFGGLKVAKSLMSGKWNRSSFTGFGDDKGYKVGSGGGAPSVNMNNYQLPLPNGGRVDGGGGRGKFPGGAALRGTAEATGMIGIASPSLGEITDWRLTKSQAAFRSFNLGGTLASRRGDYEREVKHDMRMGTNINQESMWRATNTLSDSGFNRGMTGYGNVRASVVSMTNMNPGMTAEAAASSYAQLQQGMSVNKLASHGINLRDSKGAPRSVDDIAKDLSRRVDAAYTQRGGNVRDKAAYTRDINNAMMPGNTLNKMLQEYFPDNPGMQEQMRNALMTRAQTGSVVSTKKQNEKTGLTTDDINTKSAKEAAAFEGMAHGADNMARGFRAANDVLGVFHRLLGQVNGSLMGNLTGFGKGMTGDIVGGMAGAGLGRMLMGLGRAGLGGGGGLGIGSRLLGLTRLGAPLAAGAAGPTAGVGSALAASPVAIGAAAVAAAAVPIAIGFNKRKWFSKHKLATKAVETLVPGGVLVDVGRGMGWAWDKVHHKKHAEDVEEEPRGGDVVGKGEKNNPLNMLKGLSPSASSVEAQARSMGYNNLGGVGSRPENSNSDHPSGNAIDIMVPLRSARGTEAAEYFRTNRAKFNVKYLIWDNKFADSGTGWNWESYTKHGRAEMQNSATGRHEDHVHVSVNGGGAVGLTGGTAGAGAASKRVGLKNSATMEEGGLLFNSSTAGGAVTGSTATTNYSGAGVEAGPLGPYKAAIAKLESGGSYTARSKTSSAAGKYQVTKATWGGYGGYASAADAPPAVQEQFFETRFGGYLRKYGVDGAAVAWFQGPGVASGKVHGIVDANGTTTAGYLTKYRKALGSFGQPTAPQKAKGAWDVSQDEFARLHQGEMVVPAKLAGAMREALAAKPGSSGATNHVTINLTVKDASDQEAVLFAKRVKKELEKESVLTSIRSS